VPVGLSGWYPTGLLADGVAGRRFAAVGRQSLPPSTPVADLRAIHSVTSFLMNLRGWSALRRSAGAPPYTSWFRDVDLFVLNDGGRYAEKLR